MPDRSSRLSRAPSRALVVVAALLVQLAGAACLVLGLAAIPITHDLHHSFAMLAVWGGGALLALVTGGLAHRGRIVPLLLAAVTTAAMGFVLPRGDSAVGVLANLWPHGALPEQVVVVAAIAMFAIAACCIAVLPWAVPYRAWWRDQVSPQPARTLLGIGAVVPRLTRAFALPVAPSTRRAWLVVSALAVAVGAVVGVALVELHIGGGRDRRAEPKPMPAVTLPRVAPALQRPAGAASPERLAAALATGPHAAALAELVDADAFAWGIDAGDVATGRAQVVALVDRELAAGSNTELVEVSTDGSLGWFAQHVSVGARRLQLTAIAHEVDGHWTIAALCIAEPLGAGAAAHLAKAGRLVALAPLPAPHPHTDDLVAAARAQDWSAAEHGRIAVTSITAATFNPRIGWTAADLAVEHERRDAAPFHEPMRVLAAWVKNGDGWHIAFVHTTYGGPLR